MKRARPRPEAVPLGALQLLFVIAAMAATFLLVPRGFSAGEIDIQSDHMSWNTTKGTYQLNLLARIPINNPNFLNVSSSTALPQTAQALPKISDTCSQLLLVPTDDIAWHSFLYAFVFSGACRAGLRVCNVSSM